MTVAREAAGEQDAQSVVGEVAEPATGTLDLFDQEVGRLDRAVGRARRVVGEDLPAPASQRFGEASQFLARLGCAAPRDGVVERDGGSFGVVGEVDVSDLLLGDPGVLHLAARVAVAQRRPEPLPARFVDAFSAEEEQLARP